MARDMIGATRQNHALEHATVSVLISRLGTGIRLAGRATPRGFYLYGDLPEETVATAAHEALRRLNAGEADLAVSPFCGTNLAVGAVLSATASAIALGSRNRVARLPQAILASIWALLLAQILGRYVQKYVTTSPYVSGLRITGISRKGFGPLTIFHVGTARD